MYIYVLHTSRPDSQTTGPAAHHERTAVLRNHAGETVRGGWTDVGGKAVGAPMPVVAIGAESGPGDSAAAPAGGSTNPTGAARAGAAVWSEQYSTGSVPRAKYSVYAVDQLVIGPSLSTV